MLETYVDKHYRTFTEETAGQLTNKEGYAVELTANGTVQLFTSGICIGFMHSKLQGANDVVIRLLAPTYKVIAGGAIAIRGQVKGLTGGKVVAATTGSRALGIKISPTAASADGDTLEIITLAETAP